MTGPGPRANRKRGIHARRLPPACARRRREDRARLLAIVAVAALLSIAPTGTASAEFTPPSLISGTPHQQFEEANAPALSADGRYAVFQGAIAGISGIWRRDLQTGEVKPVAAAYDPGNPAFGAPQQALSAPDAAAPSVSANGRYVAFTTTTDLDPGAEPPADAGCPEVYVRDMEPASGEAAYTLASALNGTSEGISYEGTCPPPEPGPVFSADGAQAAGGVALSADGRHVVFTVLSRSNLAGPGTEPSQVAVRDLETDTTTLVSVTPDGGPVQGGGAFPSTESFAHGTLANISGASSAAISADASTVAWLGTNVSAQVSAAEAARAPSLDGYHAPGREVEPLWRRVADGTGAQTRRLLAGAGLDFFYERFNEQQADTVLAGSFVGVEGALFIAPALSADGSTVAMVADAPPVAIEPSLNERANLGISGPSTDAYVVRVGKDPASPPVATPLTEVASYQLPIAAIEGIYDVAISPDGTRVAFDTARTQFYLPALALISPPVALTEVAETYEANIALGTLQRVTTTYDGAEPNGEAGLLSFAGDGQGTLAFASRATNLFYGDAVNASQTYLTRETSSGIPPTPQEIGAPPQLEQPGSRWLLSATATAEPDGTVLVVAQAPGAGRLAVKAGAQLPPPAASASARSSRRGGAHKAAREVAHASAARAGAKHLGHSNAKRKQSVAVPVRTVAQAAVTIKGAIEARLRLRVGSRYKKLVAAGNGLYAVLRLTFAAPGRKTLVTEVPVTFHVRKRRPAARRAKAPGRVAK
jgi:hypothetical protein